MDKQYKCAFRLHNNHCVMHGTPICRTRKCADFTGRVHEHKDSEWRIFRRGSFNVSDKRYYTVAYMESVYNSDVQGDVTYCPECGKLMFCFVDKTEKDA